MSQQQHHTVNGKATKIKDMVHYTDETGIKHAARIEHIDGNETNLHLFHAHGASKDTHLTAVPHSATGTPHSWTHFPD